MLATLNRQLPTLSNDVARSAGVLIKRWGCSRLSQRFPLVENRCSAVGIPGGIHESRVWWRISYSPCAWSSFEIIIHDCWLLSVLTLRTTSAKTRCNAAHSTKYLCVVCCFKTVKRPISLSCWLFLYRNLCTQLLVTSFINKLPASLLSKYK